jgi:DNA mismatch repair ATPase MutS
VPGSRAIARLRTLVDLINSRHNIAVRILDAPLMYSVQVAFAAEHWREAHGSALRLWVNTIGEMEALLSLATYSFEHPADPFPEFAGGAASFEGEELGHPLVPATLCVRNDVSIRGETRVLLVSGSNMSGKSTLLRAVGMNVVLAMAGAPVRARRLRLTPLRVGASIRVNDSLQEGSSRFYAEIMRLRQIFDFAGGNPPLLFLLDELLQGTNSNDRRIGAEGIVRALVNRGAIGLVSTHDLALTDIGGSVAGRLRNVHFQDELANGRMTFDYKLRDGVVTKSNGLELMRSIGLDV